MQRKSLQKKNQKTRPQAKKRNANKTDIDFPTINFANTPPLNFTTRTLQEGLYFDYYPGTFSATSTVQVDSLFDNLLNSAGILATNDTYARPLWVGTAQRWTSRIRIDYMDVRVQAVGSQGTALIAADLFNTVRAMIFVSPTNYQAATPNALVDTIRHPLTNNIAKVVCDETFLTWTAAFDSADLNSPTHVARQFSCPVGMTVDCITNNTRTTWDTKAGDLVLNWVSDSTLTPHPQFLIACRIHFSVLRG
jgi:hypothetical protein